MNGRGSCHKPVHQKRSTDRPDEHQVWVAVTKNTFKLGLVAHACSLNTQGQEGKDQGSKPSSAA